MENIVFEMRYEAAEDLLNDLLPWSRKIPLKDFVFRGHDDADYQLVPTALRKYEKDKLGEFRRIGCLLNGQEKDSELSLAFAEYRLLRDFYRKADSRGLDVPRSDILREKLHREYDSNMLFDIALGERWLPVDMLESAALAQHYGIPTRLLDWTYDPFVAAFFSSLTASTKNGDLCIWGLNTYIMGSPALLGQDSPFRMITPHYSGNPNLAAQKGLFTHWSTKLKAYDELAESAVVDRRSLVEIIQSYLVEKSIMFSQPIFIKMLLPMSKASDLALCLRDFGYGPAKIFPGYAGVADEMLNLDRLIWKS